MVGSVGLNFFPIALAPWHNPLGSVQFVQSSVGISNCLYCFDTMLQLTKDALQFQYRDRRCLASYPP